MSEPGNIAKQMLEHLGGLGGAYLVADIDTLKLLNKMAGGLRRKRNEDDTIEESFGLRTASLKDWVDLIQQRKARGHLRAKALAAFTNRNVIRIGIETECPHCSTKNWNTLTTVDYRITCERCLKPYDFPQAALREHNRRFSSVMSLLVSKIAIGRPRSSLINDHRLATVNCVPSRDV